ncbi:MAG: beta-ketoacyl synthase N-terminal-like domain-containing protein, partial [Gammaproteobacteria bacterium]
MSASTTARRRVVITGVGAFSPLGNDWTTVRSQLLSGRNVIRRMHEWEIYEGLSTQLACNVAPFELPAHYNRKTMRSMGRVAVMATRATEIALASAGLLGDPFVKSGQMGISYGSSAGTPSAIGDFGRMISEKNTEGINANTYIKMMSHTAAV